MARSTQVRGHIQVYSTRTVAIPMYVQCYSVYSTASKALLYSYCSTEVQVGSTSTVLVLRYEYVQYRYYTYVGADVNVKP